MRRVVPLVMGIAVTGLVLSPLAMAKVSKENVRAVNAARMRAEAVNGGLSNYRAAKCMYATGQGGGDCLRSDSDGLVLFLAAVPLVGKKQVNHQRWRPKFKCPLMARPSLI